MDIVAAWQYAGGGSLSPLPPIMSLYAPRFTGSHQDENAIELALRLRIVQEFR
jgi:hypothetical protein